MSRQTDPTRPLLDARATSIIIWETNHHFVSPLSPCQLTDDDDSVVAVDAVDAVVAVDAVDVEAVAVAVDAFVDVVAVNAVDAMN